MPWLLAKVELIFQKENVHGQNLNLKLNHSIKHMLEVSVKLSKIIIFSPSFETQDAHDLQKQRLACALFWNQHYICLNIKLLMCSLLQETLMS